MVSRYLYISIFEQHKICNYLINTLWHTLIFNIKFKYEDLKHSKYDREISLWTEQPRLILLLLENYLGIYLKGRVTERGREGE